MSGISRKPRACASSCTGMRFRFRLRPYPIATILWCVSRPLPGATITSWRSPLRARNGTRSSSARLRPASRLRASVQWKAATVSSSSMMRDVRSSWRRAALITSVRLRARPGLRFLFASPAHFLALGFGAGLAPVAPGTFGTLIAWPLFWLLQARVDAVAFLALVVVLYILGIGVCGRTGRDLGVQDHKAIVWDEIVAFLLVLFFTPRTLPWQCIAFVLFRLFDALKPGPIRIIESRFHGG